MNKIQVIFILLTFSFVGIGSVSARDYTQVKEDCDRLKEASPEALLDPPPGYVEPVPLVRFPPDYPQNSPWRQYVCVALQFDVNERGRTENVKILEFHPADAPSNFRYKARDAIKKWKYSPATQNGVPVRREGAITVVTYELIQ
ncbi:TonB family protein [Hyphococcus sp.]|uniref:TonB family protein n=1 Tax=Hyphococcus sp. TaxID=2038636 RepID=UPI0020890ACC|nr:MAG: hypothetical protein DHS20C04_13700 [Marinicaulis sp.]